MSLEGLLAIAGIVLAVYAIAQPVQRRSISLFVPGWLVPISLVLSAIILVWREGVLIFRYQLYPWSDFTSTLLSFLLPVITTLVAVWLWCQARLTKGKDNRFRRFILACFREGEFDELVRIIEKNRNCIGEVCTAETLDLLFEPRFIDAMTKVCMWLHLRLLSDGKAVERVPDRFRVSDVVMRSLISEPSSPLCVAVTRAHGGEECSFATEEEWKLVGLTLQNPAWYMSVRADYPLIMVAREQLDSGRLDDAYNRNDDLYIARQGVSSRSRCPIYLAMKTHVLMLDAAVKKDAADDTDYYVSDLWDVLRIVCDHSVFDREIWENPRGDSEFPTPFVFLLKEIQQDLYFLCDHCFSQGQRPPGRLGHDLVRIWAGCVLYVVKSKGKVSLSLQKDAMGNYLDFTWGIRRTFLHNTSDEEQKNNCEQWLKLFISEIRKFLTPDESLKTFIYEVLNALEIVNAYVVENDPWIRNELGLPDRPRPQN